MTHIDPGHNASFARRIGMVPVSAADGRSEWTIDIDDTHMNRGGICHGGVIATVADTAIGSAVNTVRTDAESWQATVDLTVIFLEAIRQGDHLVATGNVVRRGSKMAYGEAELHCGDKLVARAHSSYVIFKKR